MNPLPLCSILAAYIDFHDAMRTISLFFKHGDISVFFKRAKSLIKYRRKAKKTKKNLHDPWKDGHRAVISKDVDVGVQPNASFPKVPCKINLIPFLLAT